MNPRFNKDPNAVLDYGFDWASWVSSGETISISSWSVSSLNISSASVSSHTAIVFVNSGGILNASHTLTNRITTSRGRIDERSLDIIILDR